MKYEKVDVENQYVKWMSGDMQAREELIKMFYNLALHKGRLAASKSLESYYQAEALYYLVLIIDSLRRVAKPKDLPAYIAVSLELRLRSSKVKDLSITVSENDVYAGKYKVERKSIEDVQVEQPEGDLEIELFLEKLDQRQQRICLLLLEGYTQEEVGTVLGVQQACICKILKEIGEKYEKVFPGLRRRAGKLS
jgi:DNA-directed RNA polymerase specialized sigma24 family protein